ncbi:hypothetical protein CKK33_18575 [Mucilaginibacter sp. MD40]|uniref:hypothetical protein n=1 Tax=Mucilaginibacter sp. MD40 TaxID=2029590 RepID=UPI000BAC829F|nr:hypothetical protein [Mucilaginibacter sp. MD40]PAW95395.1 hypothetical protein CKK33_18575 [Mucilaginibacter sp. MD40]
MGFAKDYGINGFLPASWAGPLQLFRFLLPAAGLYDLLSFFPFSFKNNQSGQGGERKSKQQNYSLLNI